MGQFIPQLENLVRIPLTPWERDLLSKVFANYSRVVIKAELGSGFSGSSLLLVRPILEQGTELPFLVKLGSQELIRREWEAYQTYFMHKLPGITGMIRPPVFLSEQPYGCLQYVLTGSGTVGVEPLSKYYSSASLRDMSDLLESRLFRSMDKIWSNGGIVFEYLVRNGYEDLLPVNLVVQETESINMQSAHVLHPDIAGGHKLETGDSVIISGFRVVEVIEKNSEYRLDSALINSKYPIQVKVTKPNNSYELGHILNEPIYGIIIDTRSRYLQKSIGAAIGASVDLSEEFLGLSNGNFVPNPITYLPKVLKYSFDAKVSTIHGDLNLDNIIVEPESGNVFLIDFIHAKQNHVLRDLNRLEMDFITRLFSIDSMQVSDVPSTIFNLFERLHCAVLYPGQVDALAGSEKVFDTVLTIRRAAQRYLSRSRNWREYYLGLFVQLLGAFKERKLGFSHSALISKQVAFWGAAAIASLLETESSCADVVDSTQQETGTLSSEKVSRQELARIIAKHFDREELRALCFQLAVDYDALPGRGMTAKVRELVEYCERYGRLWELIDIGKQRRPNISWSEVSETEDAASTLEPQTTTSFYGPVTGPIHTGSGNISLTPSTDIGYKDVFSDPEPKTVTHSGSGDINLTSSTDTRHKDAFSDHEQKTATHFYSPVTGQIHTGDGDISLTLSADKHFGNIYSDYQVGIKSLLERLNPDSLEYSEALLLQQMLEENINRAHRYGDTETRQADRAEIIDRLNRLTISSLNVSFSDLLFDR